MLHRSNRENCGETRRITKHTLSHPSLWLPLSLALSLSLSLSSTMSHKPKELEDTSKREKDVQEKLKALQRGLYSMLLSFHPCSPLHTLLFFTFS